MVLAMAVVALAGNALAPGCSTHTGAPPNLVGPVGPLFSEQPAEPAKPVVRQAASLPAADPAPIVAIVVRPLQETDDKAADKATNQAIIIDMVAEAIELTGGLADIIQDGQTILIKPNLTNHRGGQYFPSMTTDVRVMAGVIEALQKNTKNNITIAEGSGPPATEMFPICGYDKLAEKYGLELMDLNTPDKFVNVQISREVFQDKPLPPALPVSTGKHVMKQYPVPAPYMDADIVINVPCLKTHCLTGTTVAMKNLYGLFPGERQDWHADVEANLADVARLRKTSLVVVDGIVAMEGYGPLWGTPVKMNLVIVGRDMVAVDAVAAAVMGYDPKRVLNIQYAALQGLGVADLDKIVVKGTPIDKAFRQRFYDGHWSFALTCPLTDANIAKLMEQKQKQPIGGWMPDERGKVIGWETSWGSESLPLDKDKYPDVKNGGFRAAFNKHDPHIHFNVEYRALYREDIEPLKETMQAWIDANMETKAPTSMPTTFPHLGEDARAVQRALREQQQR